MRSPLFSLALLGLLSPAAAVYQDEVGHVDFHHALVGVPQPDATFFHRPRKNDKASLLYTLGDVGVLGAVNPSNGEAVWRQQISGNASAGADGFVRAAEDENWVAAASGRSVHAWDALTGRNVWHMEFEGEARDLEIVETADSARKDVLALFDEHGTTVVRRLHGALGTVVWEFREVSKDVPLQVSTNIANIYVVSLHGSPSSYSLRINSLDLASGARVDNWSIGTKGDVHAPEDVMFVGANSAAPILAWTDAGRSELSVHVLGQKSKQDFALPADTVSVHVHAPHLVQSQPHFLVHTRTKTTNRAEVYHTNLKTSQVTKAYDLPQLAGPGAFSTSSSGANVYFTRITGDEVLVVSSESHGVLARWPFKPKAGVEPVAAVSEVIKKPGGEGYAVRAAATTASDDWIMIRNGEQDWTRHEGMTGAVAAVFAEISEVEELAKVLEQEAHTNPVPAYIHRLQRHVEDLQYLPGFLAALPVKILNSIVNGDVETEEEGLHRDTFGFNKIVVLVTRRGRFYGLNTGNKGEVMWSTDVLPQAAGEVLEVKGIISKDDEGVVVVRGSRGESATVEAKTGKIVETRPAGPSAVVSGTAVVEGSAGKWLLPIGPNGQPAEDIRTDHLFHATIVVREGDDIIKGFKYPSKGGRATGDEVWQLQMLPGQKIVEVASPVSSDPVASIGRVLADRRVSYKYLNQNHLVVAAVDDAASTLSVQLLDTISGQVLASQVYGGVDATQAVSCATDENWYACTFFGDSVLNDGTQRSIKGYQVVVTDLYESASPNDRGPLGDAANFSSLNPVDDPSGAPLPWVVSQAYVISQQLTSLSVTQTRQGIATRQLLGYLPQSHGVIGLPRPLIDPRRPVGRDPTAAEMEAEGLGKYAAGMEIDPRSIVSHLFDVIGVEAIIAAPAVVESTSLVVAYGVDVFGTRVAPSGVFDILGNSFNKMSLIATVLALFMGVVSAAPMVRRKQIDLRWGAPT